MVWKHLGASANAISVGRNIIRKLTEVFGCGEVAFSVVRITSLSLPPRQLGGGDERLAGSRSGCHAVLGGNSRGFLDVRAVLELRSRTQRHGWTLVA